MDPLRCGTRIRGMRRLVPLAVAICLCAPSPASAKFLVTKARACGASACKTTAGSRSDPLSFQLVLPMMETGLRTVAHPPAARDHERFAVRLSTWPRSSAAVLAFLPDPGYIHVRPLHPRSDLPRAGWLRLGAGELAAYGRLTEGLAPKEPDVAQSPAGGRSETLWAVLAVATGTFLLVAAFLLLRGRRPAS
jgi:hypothetical protein